MGATFGRAFIMKKSPFIYETQIQRAAKGIGYTLSAEGKGVPLRIAVCGEGPEWFLLDSPLLDMEGDTADALIRALSREFKVPALMLSCFDSDFALCRLIDTAKGTETAACINEPYEEVGQTEFDASLWVDACKKKWKCREKQFKEVFSGEYVFAEDGLLKLAELIKLPAEALDPEVPFEDPDGTREFWLMPEAKFEAAPVPRTLSERLAAYIDETFADKLTRLGYRRFNGSSLRWHKVIGPEGKEIVSSIVFVVRYGWDINIFFGSQAVCCPLVLSDKYYPMHDHFIYLYDAVYEFPKYMGYDPRRGKLDGSGAFDFLDEPEKIFPYMNAFVPELLEKVTDIASLRSFVKKSNDYDMYARGRMFSYSFAYRMLVEALLDGDEKEAFKAANRVLRKYDEIFDCPPGDRKGADLQELPELPRLFLEKGVSACTGALEKVRGANMKKLKKGGIV